MTANDFRREHGDPTGWTSADMETFEHLAEIDQLPATVTPLPQSATPAHHAA